MASILNIAGYRFVSLSELPRLKEHLVKEGSRLALKGTILLSSEGININLAGQAENIAAFQDLLQLDDRFSAMVFKSSYSTFLPYKRFKVKIKKEIITIRQPNIQPETAPAPHITPQELKQWLDEEKKITLLDTRNEYEIAAGTFRGALNLNLRHFCEFPEKLNKIPQDKPVVMFCTGGIRCEKAAWVLLNAGYKEVYQLQGGILQYFAEAGGAHYEGDCFVFDERHALDSNLRGKNNEFERS